MGISPLPSSQIPLNSSLSPSFEASSSTQRSSQPLQMGCCKEVPISWNSITRFVVQQVSKLVLLLRCITFTEIFTKQDVTVSKMSLSARLFLLYLTVSTCNTLAVFTDSTVVLLSLMIL